jgi:hypothetical protein
LFLLAILPSLTPAVPRHLLFAGFVTYCIRRLAEKAPHPFDSDVCCAGKTIRCRDTSRSVGLKVSAARDTMLRVVLRQPESWGLMQGTEQQ